MLLKNNIEEKVLYINLDFKLGKDKKINKKEKTNKLRKIGINLRTGDKK